MNPLLIFGAIQIGLIVVILMYQFKTMKIINFNPWKHGLTYAFFIGLTNRLLFIISGLGLSKPLALFLLTTGNTVLPMAFYIFFLIGFVQVYTTLRTQAKQLLVIDLTKKKKAFAKIK